MPNSDHHAHPACRAESSSQGLSLIELLLFIVVVSIALTAMLRVFITATTASANPMILRQQLAIAESLLREVQLMPFTWCDPTGDPNVGTATAASDCTMQVEALGPEAGQTRYGPNYFNNVNDYAGFSMSGIRDLSNTAIAGLTGYAAQVAVAPGALDSIGSTGEALKITVTVTAPDSSSLVLQGWRTRYAPNAAD